MQTAFFFVLLFWQITLHMSERKLNELNPSVVILMDMQFLDFSGNTVLLKDVYATDSPVSGKTHGIWKSQ